MTNSERWFHELRRVWIEKDLAALPGLLSESFQYFESPFDPPLVTRESVQQEWEVVKHQNIETLEINVLDGQEDTGVATYRFIERKSDGTFVESRGVYWVELDEQGKAVLFRQWWMNK